MGLTSQQKVTVAFTAVAAAVIAIIAALDEN
jgi:hypothetical protein